ncbi:hypothetical protein PHLGIDRAFT_126421 [Phlebiopsis gigantea 11061_1 CR5-6]|uniref:Uncharacterized protein n=1 Tax=Phlebiopsis gigantea (strain 11061_1 CR5-6) TaxID=745531 RepID=A0A0C3NV93_PHLG1|nr:hypothetical protein PHLGIDRAFT_126421 [Phlebiopsis gigantea 11061_1 CR5-6]
MSTAWVSPYMTPHASKTCMNAVATEDFYLSLPPDMRLLPRGDDTILLTPTSSETAERRMIPYLLADGSVGVPLSLASKGPSEVIMDASKSICDGTIQKHTLSINVVSFSIFNEQKYAYSTKNNGRRGKTNAEIAKQVAQMVHKFFEKSVNVVAPEYNKLGLGRPGLRFEDLYLVALVPLEKHRRMYECVLGYREIPGDIRRPWSERYPNVFRSQEDTWRYSPTAPPSSLICADQSTKWVPHYDDRRNALRNTTAAYSSDDGIYSHPSTPAVRGYKVEPVSGLAQWEISSHTFATPVVPLTESYDMASYAPSISAADPCKYPSTELSVIPVSTDYAMRPSNESLIPSDPCAPLQSDRWIANYLPVQQSFYESEPSAEDYTYAEGFGRQDSPEECDTQYYDQAYNDNHSSMSDSLSPSRHSTVDSACDYIPTFSSVPLVTAEQTYAQYEDLSNSSATTYYNESGTNIGMAPNQLDQGSINRERPSYLNNERSGYARSSSSAHYHSMPPTTIDKYTDTPYANMQLSTRHYMKWSANAVH